MLAFILLGATVMAIAYTPVGRKTLDYHGGIIPDHSVNGALG